MKSILDQPVRAELIHRINQLDENSTPKWGEMNVYQMLKHCVLCEELYLGKIKKKRVIMGYLFGKSALKDILREDKAFPRNAPTSAIFKVQEKVGDVTAEKQNWIALIKEYENYSNEFVHWFFGKMTKDEVGRFGYKHNDHHLRQFGI